ncbi:MAG: heavy metal translocating P-type ATPase [Cytophagaceae bacterium]
MSNSTINKKVFPVSGMSCAGCAVSVESMLKSVEGVKDAGVNYATQAAWAEYDENLANPEKLKEAVQSIGYDLITDTEDPQKKQEEIQKKNYKELKRRTILASILSIPVVIIGMFFMDMKYGNEISMILSAPVIFYFGRHFFISAVAKARHLQANMDTLVSLSTGIAFFFSLFNTVYPEFWHSRGIHPHVYYEAAAVIICFISLGKLLEERAKFNTSSAIRKLIGLQPKTVRIHTDAGEQEVLTAQVVPGNIIIIRPGESIPVDGVVTEGSSYVDESMISGEPVPVLKKAGEKIFAGTINQKGSFNFRAEKVGSETVLANIIKMVQQAQGSKAPVQKLVDKIAGIFVPSVLVISVLTFLAWIAFGGDSAFTHALLTSITVLVIACPCALGLATPTAIMVGIGKGAENNILIKDAESLEVGNKVNVVVLDKTGTITIGKPVVTEIVWDKKVEDIRGLNEILFALESQSEHPLALSIVNKLKESITQKVRIENFESITGKGLTGEYNNILFFAGNYSLISEKGISVSEQLITASQSLREKANTVIYFADSKSVLCIVAIADEIKQGSKTAIAELKKKDIEVYMLTGDNPQTAAAVAKEVGIKNFKAEMLPADKADFIKQMQSEGYIVAMVGDGINDSQALAQADVSIAMGKGSDIALDVAKMTLITSDLNLLPKAFNLSHVIVNGIRQNLFWAFIYNVVGIPVAAGILFPFNGFLLNPMIAGAAMALSSVSVVANSLRLKLKKI